MKEFRIGDIVKVKNKGNRYPDYINFFKENKLSEKLLEKYYTTTNLMNGDVVEILYIGKHEQLDDILAVIRLINGNGEVLLIGTRGLTECTRTITIDGKDIEISEESFQELKRQLTE